MAEGGGELHALLIAMGEHFDLRFSAVSDFEPLQPRRRRGNGVADAQPVESTQVFELLTHEHPRIQTTLLGHVTETTSVRMPDRTTVPLDPARVEVGQTKDRAHRGGLARTVGTKEPNDLTGRDLKGKVIQGHHVAVGAA